MENMNELKTGVIQLDQQENSPYLPYINVILNAISQFLQTIKENPKIAPKDLRPFLLVMIKLIPNRALAKSIENSVTVFNVERQLEQKLLKLAISLEEYKEAAGIPLEKGKPVDEKKINPALKAKVDNFDLGETPKEDALRLAIIDQFGMFITEYVGPKFDVDGHKMCIAIATLRNDKDVLIPTKNLTEDERIHMNVRKFEELMASELY